MLKSGKPHRRSYGACEDFPLHLVSEEELVLTVEELFLRSAERETADEHFPRIRREEVGM